MYKTRQGPPRLPNHLNISNKYFGGNSTTFISFLQLRVVYYLELFAIQKGIPQENTFISSPFPIQNGRISWRPSPNL